jgi:hypothetical protein
MTAAIAAADQSAVPDCAQGSGAVAPNDADDYVEGLARLGIARLPCQDGRPRELVRLAIRAAR